MRGALVGGDVADAGHDDRRNREAGQFHDVPETEHRCFSAAPPPPFPSPGAPPTTPPTTTGGAPRRAPEGDGDEEETGEEVEGGVTGEGDE